MRLRWTGGRATVRCPVCGRTDDQLRLAKVSAEGLPRPVVVARCRGCAGVVLDDVLPPDSAYTEAHWDWDRYIEQQAGIETIAETLGLVDVPAGARMLDVGCGYGFALDLGTHLFGWTGIGLDPSPAAERGRHDLGLDIRAAYLDAAFAPGERFDVIVVSEVIEHTTDPHALLREIAARLEPDGVAVITTPDGDLVVPETPLTTLLSILSVGHHVFVASGDGLRDMLAAAGLVCEITRRGSTLCAVASPSTSGLARVRSGRPVSLGDLADYCRARAETAAPGSALALGMAVRAAKFLAYDGRFAEAAEQVKRLQEHLVVRYGVDLDDRDRLRALADPPPIVAAAGYLAGVTARYVDEDPDLADARWVAAARAGATSYARLGRYEDPEVARFEMEALGERALMLAPTAPRDARRLLDDLDTTARRSGDHAFAEQYRPRVEAALGPEPGRIAVARSELERIARGIRRRLPGSPGPG